MSWFKYFLLAIFFLALIVFIYFAVLKHNANISSTQDIEFVNSAIDVGKAREGTEISISKDLMISNLLLQVAETQKGNHHTTEVEYVLLDENNNPTNDETEIRSIQFNVNLLNKNGKTISNSVEKIEINSLAIN